MPEENKHTMDQRLKDYAAARRQSMGKEFELSPEMRDRLRQEALSVHGKKGETMHRFPAWLVAVVDFFSGRLIWGGAVTALLALGLVWWQLRENPEAVLKTQSDELLGSSTVADASSSTVTRRREAAPSSQTLSEENIMYFDEVPTQRRLFEERSEVTVPSAEEPKAVAPKKASTERQLPEISLAYDHDSRLQKTPARDDSRGVVTRVEEREQLARNMERSPGKPVPKSTPDPSSRQNRTSDFDLQESSLTDSESLDEGAASSRYTLSLAQTAAVDKASLVELKREWGSSVLQPNELNLGRDGDESGGQVSHQAFRQVGGAVQERYRRNFNSPPRPQVLQNFQWVQLGQHLTLVDEDGSTYQGQLHRNSNELDAEFLDQLQGPKTNPDLVSNTWFFAVSGESRSLGKRVQFQGRIIEPPQLGQTSGKTNADSIAQEPSSAEIQSKESQVSFPVPLKVEGMIMVGESNRMPVTAVAEEKGR